MEAWYMIIFLKAQGLSEICNHSNEFFISKSNNFLESGLKMNRDYATF